MNTEQLRAEFRKRYWEKNYATSSYDFNPSSLIFSSGEAVIADGWFREGYAAAAKSRDELIGKLFATMKKCDDLFSEIRDDWSYPRSECREGKNIIEQALAEAKAQGYGE